MVRIPSDREPTHPGEMLLQEFLLPLDMDAAALGDCYTGALSARQRGRSREAGSHSQHRAPASSILWDFSRILDQSAATLGPLLRPTRRGGADRKHSAP